MDTPPVKPIGHQRTVQRVGCARSTGQCSTAHRYGWAPRLLNTLFVVYVNWCTETIVQKRLGPIQSCANTNGHRVNWAQVQLCTVPIAHESVMHKLFGTGSIVHRCNFTPQDTRLISYLSYRSFFLFFVAAFCMRIELLVTSMLLVK